MRWPGTVVEEDCEDESGASPELEEYRMCVGSHKESNPGGSPEKEWWESQGWEGAGQRDSLAVARNLGVATCGACGAGVIEQEDSSGWERSGVRRGPG